MRKQLKHIKTNDTCRETQIRRGSEGQDLPLGEQTSDGAQFCVLSMRTMRKLNGKHGIGVLTEGVWMQRTWNELWSWLLGAWLDTRHGV
ncbi:unnamed protein product [Lathyrus sativus]|nr:unnamed protein product [Lathyrus sativus]